MNSIPKILRSRRILSISCDILRKHKSIKCSDNVTKFRRVANSGCVIAGCCFSKQPDEEAFLPKTESNFSDNSNVPKIDVGGYGASGDIKDAVMKRKADCVIETVSNDSSSVNILQTEPKETNITQNFVITNQDKGAKQNIIKDLNSNNCSYSVLSEPPSKKAKSDTEFGENTKYKIIQNRHSSNSSNDLHSVHISEPKPKTIKTEKDFPGTAEDKSEKCKFTHDTDVTSPKSTLNKKGYEKTQKQRPNYFVAVQISNDEVLQSLISVQDSILQQEERLAKSMISAKTMHITLMVMYIGDVETHGRAMKALQNVHQEHNSEFSKNPLELEFKGLGNFHNRVLYAKVSNDDGIERLSSLAHRVKEHFAAASLFTTDSTERFTPHLTVAKIDFKSMHKGVRKIDPLHYKEFSNDYFGSQKVESIQLLRMTGPKNEAGYYSGDELFFSGFHLRDRIDDLKKSLSIEEQKKDVKDMINKLMNEKLK